MAVNHEERAARAWPVLTEIAQRRTTITYGKLGKAIGIHQRPVRYVLGLVQEYCLAEKLPPLTILVVQALGAKPGSGFIAWNVNSLDEGRQKVFEHNWTATPNPFAYAASGSTQEDLASDLLEDPERAADVYSKVRARGMAQKIFRAALLEAYEGTCAFCGFGFHEALDAAHIFPWELCSLADRLNPRNGLLLCAVHHRLFDEGFFEITSDYRIEYDDPEVTKYAPYSHIDRVMSSALHRKKLNLPREKRWQPDPSLIAQRRAASNGKAD